MRKATVSFVMSLCLYVRPPALNNSPPTQRIFVTYNISGLNENQARKFKFFFLNITRITVLHMKRCVHLWSYFSRFFFAECEMFQTKFVDRIKTQVLCSLLFSWKSRRLWNNAEIYGRAGQATDGSVVLCRVMRFACRVTKARHTQTQYWIFVASQFI